MSTTWRSLDDRNVSSPELFHAATSGATLTRCGQDRRTITACTTVSLPSSWRLVTCPKCNATQA